MGNSNNSASCCTENQNWNLERLVHTFSEFLWGVTLSPPHFSLQKHDPFGETTTSWLIWLYIVVVRGELLFFFVRSRMCAFLVCKSVFRRNSTCLLIQNGFSKILCLSAVANLFGCLRRTPQNVCCFQLLFVSPCTVIPSTKKIPKRKPSLA